MRGFRLDGENVGGTDEKLGGRNRCDAKPVARGCAARLDFEAFPDLPHGLVLLAGAATDIRVVRGYDPVIEFPDAEWGYVLFKSKYDRPQPIAFTCKLPRDRVYRV